MESCCEIMVTNLQFKPNVVTLNADEEVYGADLLLCSSEILQYCPLMKR